ncbi:hypothetical protein CBS101457_004971 [Exobasidium rhododendri]|nr:hypothetical protein CBS101457_004971 [Exobasidium rhododendri]
MVQGYRYDPEYIAYNLNTNRTARDPTDYWGERAGHTYTPSPTSWRFPFYTLMLDRFVNGDPFNDNINNTYFERDINSNQIRHGGDLRGLLDTLDYLQGMGIKGLYLAGSVFLNLPWVYDGYSPVDLSLLDAHFGDLQTWHVVVDAIHARGMYIILDNTYATLGDLLGFEGYLNVTAPFDPKEHPTLYKTDRQYLDFEIGTTYNATCQYPRFWNETGYPVDESVNEQFVGCYDGEFDQYGDTEAFGVYPDYRRQLTKFASVQDRLREWHGPTRKKIENFYCMLIAQLDIDGFRYDKAMQTTVDAFGFMNHAMRNCARRHGKDNFFLAGEITSGNDIGAVWVGRGRQPDMLPPNLTEAVVAGHSTQEYSVRVANQSALDAAAFHYSVYRTLTRFLGMDGNLEAGYDVPLNLVDMWNTLLITNDLTNANTGDFDPRHMYGTVNPDLFRWPAIEYGVKRQLLGNFVTTLMLPGIPLVLWGEEQAFYVLDNTASNYIFGRQPISASSAWQTHGCYALDSTQYYQFPVEAARNGCHDNTVSYDHRDPSAPIRNIYKHMYDLRAHFPVLNDGGWLQQLTNQTRDLYYPGSSGLATETGMWSVMRSGVPNVQNFTVDGPGNTPVWLVYSNDNVTTDYTFDCSDATPSPQTTALLAPFDGGSTLQNLLYPYDIIQLENSTQFLGLNGSTNATGCLSSMTLDAYGYKAYVPIEYYVAPLPVITRFMVNNDPLNGHDARLLSNTSDGESDTVSIQLYFSAAVDCDAVTESISLSSTTLTNRVPLLDTASVVCSTDVPVPDVVMQSMIPSVWSWSAQLNNVDDGTHEVTVGNQVKNATDHFFFRIGQANNAVVFPRVANYSTSLVQQDESGDLFLQHSAAGADLWRYTTNWGSSFSSWTPYTGEDTSIQDLAWSGTSRQAWKGTHVRVEYFNRMTGTSDIVQEGDLQNDKEAARRFPHLFWNGPYNQYGYDAGLENEFHLVSDGQWQHQFMTEWPAIAQVNVWGLNPDNQPDQTHLLGDIDGDSVLDRLPPSSLSPTLINITAPPMKPSLAWTIEINDATKRFALVSSGSMNTQIVLFALLWAIPIITGLLAVFVFMKGFYQVKFNKVGITADHAFLPVLVKDKLLSIFSREGSQRDSESLVKDSDSLEKDMEVFPSPAKQQSRFSQIVLPPAQNARPPIKSRQSTVLLANSVKKDQRRTVLIGTMEYDIEDWKIKVKIGGLGVMAQLMGKALVHQDLIWVVPCIGGVEYPVDTPAEPMKVTILGVDYSVQVQYHQFKNIKYVLLDAPVFRQQTQAEPYPARMDDMASAIYYAAWNQCIAQAIRRFPIDLYHINDYHGCIAPLYLLPQTIPVCLSLHNAEFQGLWPMRTPEECTEVSEVYNLTLDVVQKFVQFGEVFNLLHAGASYLRVYQQGFGAVGVSKKYGRRAHLRYPIFWGLRKIGQLPNPDPTDTAVWNGQLPKEEDISVDPAFEDARPQLRIEAQKWAGLEEDPEAELFVFVGRWSMQKGVDLIADIFPTILKKHPKTQLICIGPVIDLYGKFAALKLDKLMKQYPKRVFSKPVFTALPPCIFSGAEFALIPSRDEPFGLVAVEFGRKGALGVGARVGGLGNMPGWWFTVEAVTTSHLLHQFRSAIEEALSSKRKLRATMRARSAKQRFPVAQWVENLDILQSASIRVHGKDASKGKQSKPHRSSKAVTELFDDHEEYRGGTSTPVSFVDDDFPVTSKPLPDLKIKRKPVDLHYATRSSIDQRVSLGNRPSSDLRLSMGTRPSIDQRLSLGTRPSMDLKGSLGTSVQFPSIPDIQAASDDTTPRASSSVRPSMSASLMRPSFSEGSLSGGQQVSSSLPSATSMPIMQSYRSDVSLLATNTVLGDVKDYQLQQVDPFFTDSQGTYHAKFDKMLDKEGALFDSDLCIEEYLMKSEKEWFQHFLSAKLGRETKSMDSPRKSINFRNASAAASTIWTFGSRTPAPSMDIERQKKLESGVFVEQFLLGDDYVAPRFLRNWMQLRMGDWPIYSLFLALGQIMAANSYQITLLTGQVGQAASRVYVLCAIYLASSIVLWLIFRRFPSVIVLTIPFFFYGLTFMILGLARFGSSVYARGWIQNVASCSYAIGSASGSLYFSLNFGDEGGSTVRSWIFRACVIQGIQQIYIAALWYWGTKLSTQTAAGFVSTSSSFLNSWKVTAICLPIAVLLWVIGAAIFFGLPTYYRQTPGRIPSFYTTIFRRKIILWFFATVAVQNFFLSAQFGRSWSFLWNSKHASAWQIVCLVAFFFIVLWMIMLWGFSQVSRSHSWLLPILAVGLGAPRWAQIWWGVSGMGLWLPWTNSYVASALVSRSLWLWLGLLDTIQSVGIGMILLSTMTRVHVNFTLIAAQVIGAVVTAVARACAPNKLGPGPIFPNVVTSANSAFNAWFWIGLILNASVCIGFFMFFRKEQLNKP